MANADNPYGDGQASKRIVDAHMLHHEIGDAQGLHATVNSHLCCCSSNRDKHKQSTLLFVGVAPSINQSIVTATTRTILLKDSRRDADKITNALVCIMLAISSIFRLSILKPIAFSPIYK